MHFLLIFLAFATEVKSIYHVQVPTKEECNCYCNDIVTTDLTVCQRLARFEKELSSVKDAIAYRTRYINEINELREKLDWQEYLIDTMSKQTESMKTVTPDNPDHLTSEPLIMKPDDEMQNDSSGRGTRTMDNGGDLVRNVSSLLAKVEVVENMTMEVQEELKSERRVRRHIEEDLNEARSSIKILGDKFLNFSIPVDSKVIDMEEIVFNTIESLNKTLFEDHLQKLYYKVDGVVYKNETRKLDERLENVETEMLSTTNASTIQKILDDVKNISEALNNLNDTVKEKIASEGARLDLIEEKTSKLDDLDLLTEQIGILMNASDLMHSGVSDLWNEVQDVRNYSSHLQNEFETRMTQIDNSTATPQLDELQNLIYEIDSLKANLSKTQDSLFTIQKDVKFLSADVAMTENKMYDITSLLESSFQEVEGKLNNMTELWIMTLDTKTEEILNETKKFEELKMVQHPDGDSNFEEDSVSEMIAWNDTDTDDVEYIVENESCSLPTTNDAHLIITMENNSDGIQELRFACKPIGLYALTESSTRVACENGKWMGSLPSCQKLLSEEKINFLAEELKGMNPCFTSPFHPDFPDPTDCSRFFKCWNGRTDRMRCPSKLHFNPVSKLCQSPVISNCAPSNTPGTEKLRDLIPTILIDPNNVDRPYGLMGTSDSGHLVIYTGTSFQLHCLYPDNMWSHPEWHIDTVSVKRSSRLIMSRKSFKNRITMSVANPNKEDSGVYTCITPFGKQLSVTVVVEDVTCPAIEMSTTSNQNVFYRPHPEGKYRVLTTFAQFHCKGGQTISAICLTNGTWSRPPPTEDECPSSTDTTLETAWRCPQINTLSLDPNLLLEPQEGRNVVLFKCAGYTRLIGSSFTRCTEDGTWSHGSTPRCLPR